ncbi:hypothetical protein [uncultured Helicobacter sp.]|uniref:hypothetical protein n=1 Tax=uncultured Helicobacter sp. TaxID=175537 RepID=UPI00374FCDA9
MQCDKIVDFSKGTDAKSANLPKNPQNEVSLENLHSHTAMTNFITSDGNILESTPSQEAKPSVESKADSESNTNLESGFLDSYLESRFKNTDSNLESNTTESNPMDSESKSFLKSRFCPLRFSMFSLDSAFPHFLESPSYEYFLDSVNLVYRKKKRGLSPPRPLKAPKKIKRRFFASLRLQPVGSFRQPQSISFGGRASLFPLLAQSLRRALLPPCSNDCAPRSGRDSKVLRTETIFFDFCVAKMAESKVLDSARLVLSHPLFKIWQSLDGIF